MKYILQKVDCPFCHSSGYDEYIKGAKELYNNTGEIFDVVKCRNCEFIYTNPRPTKETISYFYPNSAGYYQPILDDGINSDSFKGHILESILRHCFNYEVDASYGVVVTHSLRFLLSRKDTLLRIPKFVKGGKLLDVGCSWGGYLSKMQNYGWDVYGTEINERVVKYAQEKLGLENIRQGFFEELSWEQNFFDGVNMNMVLEHLYDPGENLRLVNSVMKQGGQLIIAVPDISGVEARLYKDKAYTLQVPQHLNHFSPRTIANFLNKAGFSVEKIVHQQFDRDLVASAGYLENQLPAKILHNRLVRKSFVKITVALLALFEKTSRMSVYARKTNG